ncbi:unnamed protein product, partial [Laminaria digitata]
KKLHCILETLLCGGRLPRRPDHNHHHYQHCHYRHRYYRSPPPPLLSPGGTSPTPPPKQTNKHTKKPQYVLETLPCGTRLPGRLHHHHHHYSHYRHRYCSPGGPSP